MVASITVAQFTELKTKVNEHDNCLNGNGKEGIKTRVALLEDSVRDIKETVKKMTSAVWGLVITIAGSVLIWFLTSTLPSILNHVGK